jgi:hypothetical protein
MQDRARILSLCIAVVAGACSSEERVLGERCRNPYEEDSGATRSDGAAIDFYGTSCAPCDADDIRLDARGCPIYVTFESCGGDICLGDVPVRLTPQAEDAGIDDDAGTDEDGGSGEEDSGAD